LNFLTGQAHPRLPHTLHEPPQPPDVLVAHQSLAAILAALNRRKQLSSRHPAMCHRCRWIALRSCIQP